MRQQKLLSLTLLLVTLSIGIVIGTLINTGVNAARGQSVASDASPLVVPNAVQLGNEFTKLAKKLEPSVVYITADTTTKIAESQRKAPQEGGGAEGNEVAPTSCAASSAMDLSATTPRRAPSNRNSPAPALSSTRTATSSPTST